MTKKNKNIKIRIFGSDNCARCQFLIKSLELAGLEYNYIDALDDSRQSICDRYNVDKLPHTQLYYGNTIYKEYTGVVSPIFLINQMEEIKGIS